MKKLLPILALILLGCNCKKAIYDCPQVDTTYKMLYGIEGRRYDSLYKYVSKQSDTIKQLKKSRIIHHVDIVNIGQQGGQSALQIGNYNIQNNH